MHSASSEAFGLTCVLNPDIHYRWFTVRFCFVCFIWTHQHFMTTLGVYELTSGGGWVGGGSGECCHAGDRGSGPESFQHCLQWTKSYIKPDHKVSTCTIETFILSAELCSGNSQILILSRSVLETIEKVLGPGTTGRAGSVQWFIKQKVTYKCLGGGGQNPELFRKGQEKNPTGRKQTKAHRHTHKGWGMLKRTRWN